MDSLLLGPRNFFDNQTRHRHISCVTIRVSITGTVSNVDANADIPFSDVVTVALYCSMSGVIRDTMAQLYRSGIRDGPTELSASQMTSGHGSLSLLHTDITAYGYFGTHITSQKNYPESK